MKRPPKPKQRPWKPGVKQKPEAVSLSRRDKLQIVGIIVGAAVVFFGGGIFSFKIKHAQYVEDDLKRFRARYHLSDEQLRQTRRLEEQFHGSGNPFTLPTHTPEEEHEHLLQHSRAMSPEDGARFLAERERTIAKKGGGSSTH